MLVVRPARFHRQLGPIFSGDQICLVPDFDDALAVIGIDAELAQYDRDVACLRIRFPMGHVPDVQEDIGLHHILESGSKGRHEHGRAGLK